MCGFSDGLIISVSKCVKPVEIWTNRATVEQALLGDVQWSLVGEITWKQE